MTNKSFYNKYVDFLKNHDLYDDNLFNEIIEYSIPIDERDDEFNFLFGRCVVITNKKGDTTALPPVMPFLTNDRTVAISIYSYVNALIHSLKIDKRYKDNKYFKYIVPMYFEKIYILENSNEELLDYDGKMRKKLLNDNSLDAEGLLKLVDTLVDEHINDSLKNKKKKSLIKEF